MVSLKNLNVYTNGNFFLEIQSDGSIVPKNSQINISYLNFFI